MKKSLLFICLLLLYFNPIEAQYCDEAPQPSDFGETLNGMPCYREPWDWRNPVYTMYIAPPGQSAYWNYNVQSPFHDNGVGAGQPNVHFLPAITHPSTF